MIRPAKFGDIPRLTEIMLEMYERSRYAEISTPEDGEIRSLLMQSIQKHGAPHGTCVFVSEKDGEVEGFIIGVLERIYHFGADYWATDLFWYATKRCPPRDAIGLFDAMCAWAEANPRVKIIHPGATDAIGEYSRTELIFKRKGFRQSGVLYERSVP